jgi:hypothetical protein
MLRTLKQAEGELATPRLPGAVPNFLVTLGVLLVTGAAP